jgi:predicted PurR-regulated permease PerM
LLLPPVLVIFATLAATPVMAQQSGTVPGQLPHITNPSVSLSAPATTPLQQQMQDDYATQLRGVQQNLLQQNSSGLTRPELGVSRALNGFTPR